MLQTLRPRNRDHSTAAERRQANEIARAAGAAGGAGKALTGGRPHPPPQIDAVHGGHHGVPRGGDRYEVVKGKRDRGVQHDGLGKGPQVAAEDPQGRRVQHSLVKGAGRGREARQVAKVAEYRDANIPKEGGFPWRNDINATGGPETRPRRGRAVLGKKEGRVGCPFLTSCIGAGSGPSTGAAAW